MHALTLGHATSAMSTCQIPRKSGKDNFSGLNFVFSNNYEVGGLMETKQVTEFRDRNALLKRGVTQVGRRSCSLHLMWGQGGWEMALSRQVFGTPFTEGCSKSPSLLKRPMSSYWLQQALSKLGCKRWARENWLLGEKCSSWCPVRPTDLFFNDTQSGSTGRCKP